MRAAQGVSESGGEEEGEFEGGGWEKFKEKVIFEENKRRCK